MEQTLHYFVARRSTIDMNKLAIMSTFEFLMRVVTKGSRNFSVYCVIIPLVWPAGPIKWYCPHLTFVKLFGACTLIVML